MTEATKKLHVSVECGQMRSFPAGKTDEWKPGHASLALLNASPLFCTSNSNRALLSDQATTFATVINLHGKNFQNYTSRFSEGQ